MQQPRRLVTDGLRDCRVAMTERGHSDTGKEVEVTLAVRVPQLGATSPLEHDRRRTKHRHERAALRSRGVKIVAHELVPVCSVPVFSIIVPMPSSVNSSSSSTCATRPSRMCPPLTPLRTACVQLSILGIIPPAIMPSATNASSWSAVVRRINVAASATSRRRPFDVGQIDQLLGAERLGDRSGGGVSVDVVRLSLLVTADRGDDRNELVVE